MSTFTTCTNTIIDFFTTNCISTNNLHVCDVYFLTVSYTNKPPSIYINGLSFSCFTFPNLEAVVCFKVFQSGSQLGGGSQDSQGLLAAFSGSCVARPLPLETARTETQFHYTQYIKEFSLQTYTVWSYKVLVTYREALSPPKSHQLCHP